ncbi:hypothetical protein FKM82_005945 [Ascaphus truei]
MGYDIERFLGYVNEGLLCCICRDVLEEPLQAPCEHAFCASCIHGWLVHHHNCPEDRQALSVTGLRPLHRYTILQFLKSSLQYCSFFPQKCPALRWLNRVFKESS